MTDIETVRKFIIGMQTYFIRTDTGQSGEMPASIVALAALDCLRCDLAASNARNAELESARDEALAVAHRRTLDTQGVEDEYRKLERALLAEKSQRADDAHYHEAEIEAANARVAELEAIINTPQTSDWFDGVRLEAAHQIERWGSAHDVGKTPMDWFWLIGFLAQKAAMAEIQGDIDKAKHHTISTSAAMLNWFRALAGESNSMRPGIEPPSEGIGDAHGQDEGARNTRGGQR